MTTALTLGAHGPGWWIVFPILFWVAAAALVATFFWRRRHGWCAPTRVSGEAVLGERYARGEITDAEYRQRLAVLRERTR